MSTKDIITSAAGSSGGGKIQFVGSKYYGVDNRTASFSMSLTDLTGGLASAPAEGDLVLIYTHMLAGGSDVNPNIDSPTGWMHIDSAKYTSSFYYKIMGSTPDTSVVIYGTFPNSASTQSASVMVFCFRGVDPITPFDSIGNLVTNGNFGSITPVTTDSVIFLLSSFATSANDGDISYSDTNGLKNFRTGQFKAASPSNDRTLIGAGWRKWAGGAYDALPFNFTNANGTVTNTSGRNYTLSLRPILSPNTSSYPFYVNCTYSGSQTGSLPSGVQEGDLMIAFVTNSSNRTVNSVPSGWTTQSNNAGIPALAHFTKTATSSEPSTYTFGFSGSISRAGVIIAVYRNAQIHATSTANSGTSNYTITPTTVYDLMVNCTVDDVSTNSAFQVWTAPTQRIYGTGGSAMVLTESAGVISPTSGFIETGGTRTVNLHIKPL